MNQKNKKDRRLSLYPLKFNEVIADVLTVKPEPKADKHRKVSKKTNS